MLMDSQLILKLQIDLLMENLEKAAQYKNKVEQAQLKKFVDAYQQMFEIEHTKLFLAAQGSPTKQSFARQQRALNFAILERIGEMIERQLAADGAQTQTPTHLSS